MTPPPAAPGWANTRNRPPIVGNQHKWDTLGPERSGVWKSLGELPEGPVMKSSPVDVLGLHLDGRDLADF